MTQKQEKEWLPIKYKFLVTYMLNNNYYAVSVRGKDVIDAYNNCLSNITNPEAIISIIKIGKDVL